MTGKKASIARMVMSKSTEESEENPKQILKDNQSVLSVTNQVGLMNLSVDSIAVNQSDLHNVSTIINMNFGESDDEDEDFASSGDDADNGSQKSIPLDLESFSNDEDADKWIENDDETVVDKEVTGISVSMNDNAARARKITEVLEKLAESKRKEQKRLDATDQSINSTAFCTQEGKDSMNLNMILSPVYYPNLQQGPTSYPYPSPQDDLNPNLTHSLNSGFNSGLSPYPNLFPNPNPNPNPNLNPNPNPNIDPDSNPSHDHSIFNSTRSKSKCSNEILNDNGREDQLINVIDQLRELILNLKIYIKMTLVLDPKEATSSNHISLCIICNMLERLSQEMGAKRVCNMPCFKETLDAMFTLFTKLGSGSYKRVAAIFYMPCVDSMRKILR
jgi:hypothetical protein